VHRCHHRGVEQGAEGDGFEMPLGLPEVVHHMYEAPHNVSLSRYLTWVILTPTIVLSCGFLHIQQNSAISSTRSGKHDSLRMRN
jgi:hypothetical protein